MGLILQIETATSSCSVALARNGEVIGVREVNERNVHAEVITNFIEDVITTAKVSYNNLDAVAVSCGPGSYTGLRIGISTAKGLCFALDKPLIAVDTLAAMAYGMAKTETYNRLEKILLCPMIDARRMEVYTGMFNFRMAQVKATTAEVIDENSYQQLLINSKILFFGDGADKCQQVLSKSPNAFFHSGFTNSATFLTHIADEYFRETIFEDVALFEPFYLKDFIAGKKKGG
jgi:tRNA threonylcarbamoyladenosine biosynthesis protein TsaB